MEHSTTVTPQLKRVSTPYGHSHANQQECAPRGGNHTPEEAAVTATQYQHAQIPDITSNKAIITYTQRFVALVYAMRHYYENNLLVEEESSTTAGASCTEAGASSSEEEVPSSAEVGNRRQGPEHYRTKLGCRC